MTVQGVRELQNSRLADEDKAAASIDYYHKGRAAGRSPVRVQRPRRAARDKAEDMAGGAAGARGNDRGRSDTAEVAEGEVKAEPSQPWATQSPSCIKPSSQVTRHRQCGSALSTATCSN